MTLEFRFVHEIHFMPSRGKSVSTWTKIIRALRSTRVVVVPQPKEAVSENESWVSNLTEEYLKAKLMCGIPTSVSFCRKSCDSWCRCVPASVVLLFTATVCAHEDKSVNKLLWLLRERLPGSTVPATFSSLSLGILSYSRVKVELNLSSGSYADLSHLAFW